MVIPSGIDEYIKRTSLDNPKIYIPKETWDKRLTPIREGKASYINDDMANLINTFERIMKGYIEEAKILSKDETYMFQRNFYTTHDIFDLADEITRHISVDYRLPIISNDSEIFKQQKAAYRDYKSAYYDGRYKVTYSFEEFCDAYDSIKPIYEAIMDKLFPKKKEIEHTFNDYNFEEIDR